MANGTKNHVTWSASYSVGVEILDQQHKGLLDFVNELFDSAGNSQAADTAYFTAVVQRAVQYIKEHFSTEEKILKAVKFPGFAEHKKAHNEFVLEVIKSAKEFEAGKRLVLTKLAQFLRNWILAHIGVMDMQYALYLRQRAKDNTAKDT